MINSNILYSSVKYKYNSFSNSIQYLQLFKPHFPSAANNAYFSEVPLNRAAERVLKTWNKYFDGAPRIDRKFGGSLDRLNIIGVKDLLYILLNW